MIFRCRDYFIQNFWMLLLGLTVVLEFILPVVLLTSFLQGPAGKHYIKAEKCLIKNITYIPNLCKVTSEDNLESYLYSRQWTDCYLVKLTSIVPNLDNLECSSILDESYESELEAFISVNEQYNQTEEYDCVINTIIKECYKNFHEISTFILVLGINTLLLIIFAIVNAYLADKNKKRKERDKEIRKENESKYMSKRDKKAKKKQEKEIELRLLEKLKKEERRKKDEKYSSEIHGLEAPNQKLCCMV